MNVKQDQTFMFNNKDEYNMKPDTTGLDHVMLHHMNNTSLQEDDDPTGVLAFIKDPSPFTCDIVSIFDECVTIPSSSKSTDGNVKQDVMMMSGFDPFETRSNSTNAVIQSEQTSSSTGDPWKKRKTKKKRRSPSFRTYYCDWCKVASFRSGQGLRFHKTLRCPSRERQLGENFFKCSVCPKTFVTRKGVAQHLNLNHPGLINHDVSGTSTRYE